MKPTNPARLALNTVTVKERWNLRQAIEGCARHGLRGIAVWREDVNALGPAETKKLLDEHRLAVPALIRGGPFPAIDAATRKAAIDDALRGIDEAVAIGAQSLLLVVGGLPAGSRDLAGARAMVRDAIAAMLPHARAAGMKLALEPLHPMFCADKSVITSLEQANDLCDELEGDSSANLGGVIDAYQTWWDPMLEREIRRAGRHGRLLGLHLDDWHLAPAHMSLDRGMMGDGVINLPVIRGWMDEAGFTGFHEVELFSENTWWKRDPDEVIAICKERYATVC